MAEAHDPGAEVLLVERAVTRSLARYGRAVDARDYDGIAATYWPDAHDEHGRFSGDAAAYVAWLREVLPMVAGSTHQFTNVLVEVGPGADRAESDALCLNVNVFGPDDEGRTHHMTSGLRYLDTWERRGDEWRVLHRRVLTEWTRTDRRNP